MAGADEDWLSAIRFWLFDFPQLEAHRPEDADDAAVGAALFDDFEVTAKISEVVEEICDAELPAPPPTSAGEAWTAIHGLMRDTGLSVEDLDEADVQTTEGRHQLLRALLCHALSDRCAKQRDYVGRIMACGRPDVQQEIMRVLQEHTQGGSDAEENAETADYSVFMDASVASAGASFECESDMEAGAVNESVMKRDRAEAFGDDTHSDSGSPQGKKSHLEEVDEEDEDDEDVTFEETTDLSGVGERQSAKESDLLATIAKLQQQLKESQQKEMDLTTKADEDHSNHRAEMLQVESKYLKTFRDLEDKYTAEVSEQKRELETLRDCEASAKQAKEENSRLRDELDVLECSKEKLSFAEEQLRKCREKIELIGDAHDALQREEKAHAEAVDKCVTLENELAQLKPLKRQLEEYRVRATDAEVALSECRDDLRRIKEKSSGLEGANLDLQRGAHLRQAETDNLQKRLQEEGGKSGNGGTAVGVGMSELNAELMEEFKTLRSEYARLKEFESKREVDSVQRLEESCDDAKRLSDKYKENYFATKSNLEDTQQLLDESKAREAKLREEVVELTEKCNQLREEMKEERKKAHKAALEAEGAHQSEKKSILEKAREDLQTLEVNLTQKIEAEREQHKEKMAQKDAQRVQLENNLSEQLKNEREKSSNSLRSAKEQAEKKMAELEDSKKVEIEKLGKEFVALKTKGEGMLRGERQKRKDLERKIKDEYEVKIAAKVEENERVTSFQKEYEQNALAKVAKRDQQIKVLDARNREATRVNGELEEKAKKAERRSKELTSDIDRLRRQLGSRFGPGGASQSQLEELTNMCKSLREENRRLKDMNPDRLLVTGDLLGPNSRSADPKEGTSFSKSTLTEMRCEYEEKIEAMEDEKRDLVMKASAATTETQKAEQRAWELDEQLAKVKAELTTAKLALQRKEISSSEFSAGLSASSKKRYEASGKGEKENTPNARAGGLPPSGANTRQDFTPKVHEPKQKKSAQKSLMDLTSKDNADPAGAAPECQQS